MVKSSGLAVLLFAVTVPQVAGQDGGARMATEDGQWWQYRGDQRLSGRSHARGEIETPAVKWTHSVAGRETLLAARIGEGPETIALPVGDVVASPAGRSWHDRSQGIPEVGLMRAWCRGRTVGLGSARRLRAESLDEVGRRSGIRLLAGQGPPWLAGWLACPVVRY